MTSIDTTIDYTQNQPKRDAFAQKFMKAVKQNGILHSMTYDRDRFNIVVDTPSGRLTQNLGNAYKEYQTVYGKARDRVLKNYVLGLKKALSINDWRSTPFAEIRKRLRPLIRSKILTENERYDFKGDDPSQFKPTPRQLFSSDANVLLGCDMGRTIKQVEQAMLDHWGLTFAEALGIAMKNLAAVSRPIFKEVTSGVFAGAWNDYHDSARLLMPELFAECRGIADPVIMIPTAERIYVTDKSNKKGLLDMLRGVGNMVSASLKIISTQMYHFVDGRPTQYEPEDSQVLLSLNMIRKPQLQAYAEQQKKIVEDYLIRTDNWAYIMSLQIFENKEDGGTASVSIWSDDQETIFPEADLIAVSKIVEKTNEGYIVRNDPVLPWHEVIEKYGHRLQKLEGFPNLYRVAPFSGESPALAEAA
ncbi:hypothetical protein [Ralstonia sp. RL]|uniref:hypothetical protein n=1 Tax=Ralstonia sp. RL TaxID=1839756 RepID=UPI00257BDEA9|nr:hypothetical protein [Ralstonia sp. RL]